MTNLREAIDALEAARGEHRRALRRVADLRNRAQTAVSRIAGATASIEEQVDSVAENSEETIEKAVQLASKRGEKLADRMSNLSASAAARTAEFRDLSVADLCAQIETSVSTFSQKLQSELDEHLDRVMDQNLQDFQTHAEQRFDALESKLDVAKGQLATQASNWSENLSELREITANTITAISETDLSEEWGAIQERLANTLIGRFAEIASRIEDLAAEVDKALKDVQTLVDGFASARKITDKTVDASSTGLGAVTSILNDLKDILEAVK
jgi:chromosome segregation ATPase